MRLACLGLALLLARSDAAAATEPPDDLAHLRRIVFERTGHDVDWAAAGSGQRPGPAAGRPLSIEDAVELALHNSPDLAAHVAQLGVARADRRQAGILPNPHLHLGLVAEGWHEIELSEDLVDLLMLPRHRAAAGATLEMRALQVADAVLVLVGDVQSAYRGLQAAEEVRRIRQQVLDLTQSAVDVARRQHEAANTSDLDYEREQVLYEQSKLGVARAEIETSEPRQRLDRLMGAWGAETTWELAERLPELPAAEVPLADLERLAVSRRLDLQAQERELAAARHALSAARWERMPGLALGVQAVRERPEGEAASTGVGPLVELQIPLFDRGQAAVDRGQAEVAASERRLEALAVRIRGDVRAARLRLQAARQIAEYYRDVVLPRRTRIVEHSLAQYQTMLIGVYTLIEARKDELVAREESVLALRDYWLARVALARELGGEYPAVEPSPTASRMRPQPVEGDDR